MTTIADVIARLPAVSVPELPAPSYTPTKAISTRLAFAVASMRNHMTDEGWQIMEGLEEAGYMLCGRGLTFDETDVRIVLSKIKSPTTVIVQDKREWDVQPGDFRDVREKFVNCCDLKQRDDIFKLTILKDAQNKPMYHKQSANEMGIHAWITYYHPTVVKKVAPYVRPDHLIRTYHTLNSDIVPAYTKHRAGCLLSGAVSGAYPLRQRLCSEARRLSDTTVMPHPGYHRNGCCTPKFLSELNKYKVAICTASIYGYTLRKLIEATACGCVVVTDLPVDDVLPGIDGNLIRVDSNATTHQVNEVICEAMDKYNPARQEHFAYVAKRLYDYRIQVVNLALNVENLRQTYGEIR